MSKLNSLKTHDLEFNTKDKNDYDTFMQNKGENPQDLYFRQSNNNVQSDDYSE